MSNLEDIPKKSIFNVPENYFEKLPARVQSRISEDRIHPHRKHVWEYALQYALPLLVVAVIVVYYCYPKPDAETILASVETADLIQYLQQEENLTMEDVVDNVEFKPEDVEAIENEIYDLQVDADNQAIEFELNTLWK